jgi:hypothetical protein
VPQPFNAPAVGGHATVLKGATSGNLKETDTINIQNYVCYTTIYFVTLLLFRLK